MDPIRRLILFGIVASVILTEPTQARALFAARGDPADRQPATATQQFIRQLAVVLRQTVKPALQNLRKWVEPLELVPHVDVARATQTRSPLQPHLYDLPPPIG